jgi:DNA polymerase-1
VIDSGARVLASLRAAGVERGGFVALTLVPGVGAGIAAEGQSWAVPATDPIAAVRLLEGQLRPRWVWWSALTPAVLVECGLRVATCWDVAAVQRLLFGGWRADAGSVWSALHELAADAIPGVGQLDLLADAGQDGADPESPIRPDGYLRPEWVSGGFARTPARLARWAALAASAADLQYGRLAALRVGGDALATARSESAAELLCVELAADGLPLQRVTAGEIITSIVGPRPRDAVEATAQRARRDRVVLEHVSLSDGVDPSDRVDLRNPAQVKALLAGAGFEVPDTRSWRLEPFRGAHPVIDSLLAWRKAERIATTYGWSWLDEHVGLDGRLRGAWSGSDGAAGRMTAQAGLHNLPADLRPAVAAEPGHVFVRADLGQIEPRVLAAVSGDPALAAASTDDDLYAPVAARLGVERSVAKVAVLAAMYGQTSGVAGEALRGLESAYPVAMRYLRAAYDAGRDARPIRTYGGRLIRFSPVPAGLDEVQLRSALAARGRFARNAVIQGAAAEFFKAWAVTVRARAAAHGAVVVLCLHDELLVHAPDTAAAAVSDVLRGCLAETARGWAPDSPVRFIAEVIVLQRWSEAKAGA